jgi:hypothetical protein
MPPLTDVLTYYRLCIQACLLTIAKLIIYFYTFAHQYLFEVAIECSGILKTYKGRIELLIFMWLKILVCERHCTAHASVNDWHYFIGE